MAGYHDRRPDRDVLTSLLNGVPSGSKTFVDDEGKAKRRQERKERKKEKVRAKAAARADMQAVASTSAATLDHKPSANTAPNPAASASSSSFWKARPTIHIPNIQRSFSITPSPTSSPSAHSIPRSTPDPSVSSSTSRTSSKRPRTPEDDEPVVAMAPPPEKKPRRAPAVKKGWKGWVAGSPEPSDKLINLDAISILPERRTRSGKAFDGVIPPPSQPSNA